MALQRVTVKLPEGVYYRLERAAAITNQSLDAVLLQTIRGNLPPSLDDAPAELRAELSGLPHLSDDDLWAVARRAIDAKQWRRHKRLLQKSATGGLSVRERSELERLRAETDRQVIRTSFALALLKWRGYTLSPADVQTDHGQA